MRDAVAERQDGVRVYQAARGGKTMNFVTIVTPDSSTCGAQNHLMNNGESNGSERYRVPL